MTIGRSAWLPIACLVVALGLAPVAADAQRDAEAPPDARTVDLDAVGGHPTDEMSRQLYDELDYQRAVQAYIWAQPLVGLAAMEEGARRIGIAPLELFIFDKTEQVNQRLQTGNNDVIYSFSYFDLRDSGPVVMEIPPGNQYGAILDAWQRPLDDVGDVGPDQGKGGKYLIVPPDYRGDLPANGYFVRRSQTDTGMLFLRAVRRPGESIDGAVERLKQTRLYPYSTAPSATPSKLRLMGLEPYDGLTPKGLDYFRLLAATLQREHANERDRVMLGMLDTIGIAAGKPFDPDDRMKKILEAAARIGRAMVANLEFNPRPPRATVFPGTHWVAGTGLTHYSQDWGDLTQVDARAALFRFGFAMQTFLDPARKSSMPVGTGAAYATAHRDATGALLDGGRDYVLHIPANVPVTTYWSVSAYDASTFSFMDAPSQKPALSTIGPLETNPDGSIDLYFGPRHTARMNANWIQTVAGKGFLALLRLYGPTIDFYAHKWSPSDIARLQ